MAGGEDAGWVYYDTVAGNNGSESLGDAVVENILDGRPMEGITCPELLEYSLRLLDATLDGGLVQKYIRLGAGGQSVNVTGEGVG